MPRPNRITYPGAVHHIMMRGNNKQRIFMSREDRVDFCRLLYEGTTKYDHKVLAFCLMPNHVHLLVQCGLQPISKALHNLNFRYAARFNYFYGVVGHLFQDRFKSLCVENTSYLKNVLRYIHLNPVAARLAQHPADYYWSSYRAYAGKPTWPWIEKDLICEVFNPTDRLNALQLIDEFTLEGVDDKRCYTTDQALLNQLYAEQRLKQKNEFEVLRANKPDEEVEPVLTLPCTLVYSDVVAVVCQTLGVSEQSLSLPRGNATTRLAQTLVAKCVRDYVHNLAVCSLATQWRLSNSTLYVRIHRLEKLAESDDRTNYLLHSVQHKLQQRALNRKMEKVDPPKELDG